MSRIERLRSHIDRLERALHDYGEGGPHYQFRGRLVTWVIGKLREHKVDIDPDNDGALTEADIEVALDDLEDLIDDKVKWPEPFDSLMDLGVDTMTDIVAAIVFRKKTRLERRLERLKARLARIEARG